jgi:hypothetical protein
VLFSPEVTEVSALFPTAVLLPGVQLLGHCAVTGGESANQLSATATIKKPLREGERLMDPTMLFMVLVHFRWKLPC